MTLVAQWSYRQRAQVQLRGEDGKFKDSIKAGTVTIASAPETNDAAVGSGSDECYAKTGATVTAEATANNGYYFLGWAVEGSDKDEYVSTKPTYTYHVSGQETRTVYARFAKQYAVTYKWAEDLSWTLTGDKQPALPDDNIVLQGDSYTISTMYSTGEHPSTIQDTVKGVPGHWVFNGWKDQKDGVDLTGSIPNVNRDYVLVGYWTWVPNSFTVKFDKDAEDATGAMNDQPFTFSAAHEEESLYLNPNRFHRPGYAFKGWSEYPAADRPNHSDSPTYSDRAKFAAVHTYRGNLIEHGDTVTLYAVWCEDKVTLFYDTADAAMGTVSCKSENVNAVTTEKASGATAAANAGYRFIGWYSETGDKLSDNASFAPQKPNGEQPEDNIWKTAHYIARFERVGDPKPIDPVKPGGDDSKDSYYFAIEKIDAQDSHALNGATFALYQYSSDGKTVNRTTATTSRNGSESGIALFSVDNKNSYEGIWYYAEVTAPEGYVLDSTEHKITKNDFSTSQSAAIRNAETVRNYRSSTPNMLNDTDHFAYVIGYKDGLVKPYGLITRAETTTIFFRLLKDSVRDSSLLTSSTYTDVPDNYWANTAISTMTGLGIVQGRSTTTFDPQSPITRAQFAAICARFDTGTSSGTQIFSDISGHWAEKYIQRAAELGWIKGFEDGTFRPDTYITRAQAMTMINRVLNRIPEEESDLLTGMNVWPDCNPGDWFYLAVQEATNSHVFKHKAGNYETWIGMSQNPDWTRYEN